MRKHVLFFTLVSLFNLYVSAKDYDVREFGVKGDGITLNTRSIQKAIDFAHENGGGRIVFSAGEYVTGTIYIKSNVTLHIDRDATILGSTNPWDYTKNKVINWNSMIYAVGQDNIGITGFGTINGRGFATANTMVEYVQKGLFKDPLKLDRVHEMHRPQNIYFRDCTNIVVSDITLKDPASWNQTYDRCKGLKVDNQKVDSKSYWNNDGIDIVDCEDVLITNSHYDAADDGICFKSHSDKHRCYNVIVRNCTIRTSANGVKFGTVSRGGFENIHLSNITVYDTFRSAFTVQAVDGGYAKNISIDSLTVKNTGNIIFLRVGDRWAWSRNPRHSEMEDIRITNVYAELTADKPDKGYAYEGPVEDNPRNLSPSIITGLPGHPIKNIVMKNIKIVSDAGANEHYAFRGVTATELDGIPEMADRYPEFSQWKELPAWGFYIRHADNVFLDNVTLEAINPDYRPPIVLDDVLNVNFENLKIEEKSPKKKQIIMHKSTKIKK